jgi:hypothetical protein
VGCILVIESSLSVVRGGGKGLAREEMGVGLPGFCGVRLDQCFSVPELGLVTHKN